MMLEAGLRWREGLAQRYPRSYGGVDGDTQRVLYCCHTKTMRSTTAILSRSLTCPRTRWARRASLCAALGTLCHTRLRPDRARHNRQRTWPLTQDTVKKTHTRRAGSFALSVLSFIQTRATATATRNGSALVARRLCAHACRTASALLRASRSSSQPSWSK